MKNSAEILTYFSYFLMKAYMCWILKRIVSMNSFEHPNNMFMSGLKLRVSYNWTKTYVVNGTQKNCLNYFWTKTYLVKGTQKNSLNEKKYLQFYTQKFCLSKPVVQIDWQEKYTGTSLECGSI